MNSIVSLMNSSFPLGIFPLISFLSSFVLYVYGCHFAIFTLAPLYDNIKPVALFCCRCLFAFGTVCASFLSSVLKKKSQCDVSLGI